MQYRIRYNLFAAVLLLAAGCGGPKAAKPNETAKAGTATAKAKEKADDADENGKFKLPASVTGTDWHIPWRVPDPKHKGRWIPVLVADAKSGVMTNADGGSPTASLSDVRVKLYRQGEPAADVAAPQLEANETERVVVGTGGCVVTSLNGPADTVLKADTIRWNMHTDKIVAEGHASVVRKPRKDGPEITQSGGRITVDTSLKGNFVIE